ncbi:glutathione binding-like protein, partial [Acinetobacter baumannii]
GVMDKQLAKHAYIAGKSYSIADIAIYPWTRSYANQGVDLVDYPNVQRWFDELSARPAVQKGLTLLADVHRPANIDETSRDNLFGKKQFAKR